MNSKVIRALLEASAVKRVRIIGNGGSFHVQIETKGGSNTVETHDGRIKSWATIDAAAKWIRNLGIGKAQLELQRWSPDQRRMKLD